MSIYMAPLENSLTDISGYKLYAAARVGANGDGSGVPAYEVDDAAGNADGGQIIWDDEFSDGFDTQDVSFGVAANDDGTGSMSMEQNPSMYFSDNQIGHITQVKLRAAVRTAARASWSAIAVVFYKDGVAEETASIYDGLLVDTTDNPLAPEAQQVVTVTPSRTDYYDRVVITGTVRLSAPEGTYPGASDIFCDAFIFGDA